MDTKTSNLTTLARLLLARHRDLADAKRPVDIKTAEAVLAGSYDVLFALGFGGTPFHVRMTALDVIRSTRTARPEFRAVGNEALRDWDNAQAQALADALAEIAR